MIVRLVERTTLKMVLARMPGVTNQSALDGFSEAISVTPAELRKTFIYYQGREMSKQALYFNPSYCLIAAGFARCTW